MSHFPQKLLKKLEIREKEQNLRELPNLDDTNCIDFYSNDYLGFARNKLIQKKVSEQFLNDILSNGATGSRLISGNHSLYMRLESMLEKTYNAEAALVYNSGYNANMGILGCVPQKNDLIIYDAYAHASIRDGINLSDAQSFKFKHNDLSDLKRIISSYQNKKDEIYIVVESIYSMDGDEADLKKLLKISEDFDCHLIVDEAHSLGVMNITSKYNPFVRIITFGKAIGCHGAAILGNNTLKKYLINFSRSFIYTTGLSPHSVATILSAYQYLGETDEVSKLYKNIQYFKQKANHLNLLERFIKSDSAIQAYVIKDRQKCIEIADTLQEKGFMVKAILPPTIPKGTERLRFCLHSYNTFKDIDEVLHLLNNFTV